MRFAFFHLQERFAKYWDYQIVDVVWDAEGTLIRFEAKYWSDLQVANNGTFGQVQARGRSRLQCRPSFSS